MTFVSNLQKIDSVLTPERSPISPPRPKSRSQSPQATTDFPRSPSPLTPAANFPHNPQIRISEYESSPLQSHTHITSMDDLISNSKAHMKPAIANKVKLKYYNQALISYLAGQGLNMNPLRLPARLLNSTYSQSETINSSQVNNKNFETYITGNGQILFLPFNPEKKKRRRRHIRDEYNDDDEDGQDNDNDNDIDNDNENDDDADPDYFGSFREESATSWNSNGMGKNNATSSSPLPDLSALYSKLGNKDNENATYHTFGIIIKIRKASNLNTKVKVNYHAHASLKYDAPDHSKHLSVDERYRISKMLDWELDLNNPDCFIPFNKDSDDKESTSDNADITDDSITSNSSISTQDQNDMIFSDTPTQKIKIFTPLQPKDYVSEPPSLRNHSNIESNLFADGITASVQSKVCDAGYYVYILPVVYPVKTPETTISPYSLISHNISIQIQKGAVAVPTLQPPQTAFLSTSPTHHYRFDDNAVDFSPGSPPDSFIQSSKASFLKKIGIRRNSASSSKSESSFKFNATSPKSIFDLPGSLSRSRAGSNAQSMFNSTHHKLNPVAPGIHNYSYELPAVRLPPSDATSTINKSIYVNKVWNNSLNYELLLPRKYIQLSPPASLNIGPNNKYLKENTFILQMKLVPLVKNLQLKRIKVNIVEKVTYFDKSSVLKNSKKPKGRTIDKVVSMLEIKTKERPQVNQPASTVPLKTQIIKGCENDNLLTFCYDANKSVRIPKEHDHLNSRSNINNNKLKQASASLLHSAKKMSRVLDNSSTDNNSTSKEDVVITNPVKLQCPLSFTANDDSNFISNVYDNLCKSSSYVTALQDESTIEKHPDSLSIFSVNSNNDFEEVDSSRSPGPRTRAFSFSSTTATNWDSVENDDKRKTHTFIPDVSFSHLKVRHRLQMSFRISKKDEKAKSQDGEPKMHHYEVIVDTPIVFVSPFCVDDTLKLPSYEDAVKTSIFETDADSPSFSITQTDSSLLSDETDSSLSANEPYATLTPCSPLMRDGSLFPYNTSSAELSSNDQVTNLVIGSPVLEACDSILHRRRKSDLSANGSIPVNATSLLSAAFNRSKERSNSLNNALATDLSSLSLTSSNSHLNTIDSVMSEKVAPPQYSPLGVTSNLSSLMNNSKESPPSYDTSLSENQNPAVLDKLEAPFNHTTESKASLVSENVGLLHNHIDDRSSIVEVESQISEGRSMNFDSLNEIDAIINMSSNNVATLNMTPTRND